MKSKPILLSACVLSLMFSSASELPGQTNFYWRSAATNGNWNDGNNWWNGSSNSTAGFGILRFDNSNQTTMTNNFSGTFNTHAIRFDNNTVRTIGGNTVRLFDSGGADPYIRNNSTGTHVINFNLEGDGDDVDPLQIQLNNTGGLTFGGTINNRGSNINIGGDRATSGANVTFNGVISGSGGLFKTNSNITAVFNAANTFTGITTVEAGTIRLGSSGASFGGVTSAVRLGAAGMMDLNGFSTTVRYVSERASGDGGVVTLGGATLTIQDDGSTTRFQSSINGAGNVVYDSASTSVMSLYNAQGWTGSTTVKGGLLTSSGAMQTTAVSVEGGTFRVTGSDNRLAANPTVTLSGGTFNPRTNETIQSLAATGGTLDIQSGNTLSLSNGGSVASSVLLSNGTLRLTGGTLNYNSTDAANSTALMIESGATLTGAGTVGGALTVSGSLAPGSSIGTLTAKNNVTWNGGASASSSTDWRFELGTGNSSDLLDITGNFTKGGGDFFRFDFLGSAFQGVFDLVTWSVGTSFAAGDFSYTNLGGGLTGSFSITGNTLQFTAVPEPTGAVAGLLLGLGMLRRRR